MEIILIITILLFIWSIRELAVGILLFFYRLNIKHDIRIESTRRKFAECRINLSALAIENKINMKSETFQAIYGLTTSIMRRPDKYPEISQSLRNVILNSDHSQHSFSKLEEESKDWSDEVKEVVKQLGLAMESIIVDYSSLLRLLFWLEYHFKAMTLMKSTLEWLIKKVDEYEKNKNSDYTDIRSAQEKIYSLV